MDDAGKGIGNGNAGHGGRHMEFFLCGQALGLGQVHIDRVGEIIQHIQGSLGSDGLGKTLELAAVVDSMAWHMASKPETI